MKRPKIKVPEFVWILVFEEGGDIFVYTDRQAARNDKAYWTKQGYPCTIHRARVEYYAS